MSIQVPMNGVIYIIPENFDGDWGDQVTQFLQSTGINTLQKFGGSFILMQDVNFGTSKGLLAKYFTSVSDNPALSGVVRLSNSDSIAWRNGANSGDILLGVNGSDEIIIDGSTVVDTDSHQVLTNKNYKSTISQFSSGFTLNLQSVDDVLYECTSASLVQVTLPSDTAVDIPIGSLVILTQSGAGQIELIAGSGATLQNPFGTAKSRTQFATISAIKIAANTWRLTGDFASS